MNKQKLESAKNLFFIALAIDMVVTVLVIFSGLWSVGVLKDVGLGHIAVDESTIRTMEFLDSFAKVTILTVIGVGLTLVKWLNACYGYAKEVIGATGFKNEGWTWAGWIIPVLNFFKPYQIVSEIYRAGSPTYSTTDDWKKESGSGPLLSWWIFWGVTHFIGVIASRVMVERSSRHDMTLDQYIGAIEFQMWFCFFSLLVAGLWIFVAGSLTQRLLARRSLGGTRVKSTQAEPMTQQTSAMVPQVVHANPVAKVVSGDTHKNAETQTSTMHTPTNAGPVDEDSVYIIIAEELESGKTEKGLWTRLFAECGGDEKQTKVLYITRRAEKLLTAERARREQLAFEEAEAQRRLALEAEKAEQWHQRNAGLADAVSHGNWSTACQMLESGVSPFGMNDDGIPLRDLAIKRGDQQMVDLLEAHQVKSFGPQVVEALSKFHAGAALTWSEVSLLAVTAARDANFVMMRSVGNGYTLLHWCGRLGLDTFADVLLNLGADAAALNSDGKPAHLLTESSALAIKLEAAASAAR